jgi:hypothetical protein
MFNEVLAVDLCLLANILRNARNINNALYTTISLLSTRRFIMCSRCLMPLSQDLCLLVHHGPVILKQRDNDISLSPYERKLLMWLCCICSST